MGHKPAKRSIAAQVTRATALRLVVDDVLDLRDDRGRAPKNSKRSSGWRKVEQAHRKLHPACAICGCTHAVNVHHVLPFELFPQFELDPENLITLCPVHHLLFGHLGRWDCFNPLVRADAEIWAIRLRLAKTLMRLAKQEATAR